MYEYDLIIIGGGVAGLGMAHALADTKMKIAVLEANQSQPTKPGEHDRVSAYNLASQKLFSQLGVWDGIRDEHKGIFQHIEVWDERGDGQVVFDSVDIAKPLLGYIISNDAVVQALRTTLTQHDNIQLFCPQSAQSISISDQVKLICEDKIFTAKLIIGADGANSWLRNQLSVPLSQSSYGSSALITTVRTELTHRHTARQVFLDNGPLAFLPLSNPHYCSIVWSTTPDEAKLLQQLSSDELCARLTRHSKNKLGVVIERVDQPMVFPLLMRHVHQYVGARWALVGDAAHTLHPLAGQGINLGLQDVLCLSKIIKQALGEGRDIGLKQNLRPYERARKGDNQLMISAMQGFKTLFGTDIPVIRSLRNHGFNLVNATTMLRKFFMRRATGLGK